MAAKPEPVLPKEEEHEEDAKSEKEEYCSDGWRGSDFFSDACSVKSDEYSDDEGQRAAAALLFKNKSIQREIRRVLEEMEQQEAEQKEMLQRNGRQIYLALPRELRMQSNGPSFFSTRPDPKSKAKPMAKRLGAIPPRNVHAVRRHLFLEKYEIKPLGVLLKGAYWEQEDDMALLDIVKSALMEELFRRLYCDKVNGVPALERPQFFINVRRDIAAMPLGEMWKNVEYKANWDRISNRMIARGFHHTAKQCYTRYLHRVHPDLQKGRFSKQEDAALLKLSTRFEGYDWDAIATYMPTARNAWRCFSRYQRCLNNAIFKAGWSQEQMDVLKRSVRELGYFHDNTKRRSLEAIMSRMGPGRSRAQIGEALMKWRSNIYEINPPPWSEKQHRSFELAMEIYGHDCTDWHMLRRHVPETDGFDLGIRWKSKDAKLGDWTREEDDAFRKALKKHGPGNWTMIRSDSGIARTDRQCQVRFHKLFPEQGRLHDILLATRRRVLPRRQKQAPSHLSDLVASDFGLHLTVEEESADTGVKRITTGDKQADKHLSRINKALASLAPSKKSRKRKGAVTEDETNIVKVKAKPKAKLKAKSKAKPKAKPKAKLKAKSKAQAKAKSKAEAKAKGKAQAAQAKPKAKNRKSQAVPKEGKAKTKGKAKALEAVEAEASESDALPVLDAPKAPKAKAKAAKAAKAKTEAKAKAQEAQAYGTDAEIGAVFQALPEDAEDAMSESDPVLAELHAALGLEAA